MVSGFLGTLISLERAVALKYSWSYFAPTLVALGTLLVIVLPQPGIIAPLFILSGGLIFVAISIVIIWRFSIFPAYIIGSGVLLWFTGNVLWFSGVPIPRVVGFWAGFLIFVIAGERLELSRVLKITSITRLLFSVFLITILTGVIAAIFNLSVGFKISSVGMILLSLWLFKYDLATKTLRHPGLHRYISLSLLAGYFWLAVSGILSIAYGGVGAGPFYDAILHSLFLGFVFSMIFGHAPIIFPAILGTPIQFRRSFYIHLVLLHLTLVLRITGDLMLWIPGRYWGGMLNGIAIIIFLVNMVMSVLLSGRNARLPGKEPKLR